MEGAPAADAGAAPSLIVRPTPATPTSEPTPAVSPVGATKSAIAVAGDNRNVRLFVPDLEPDAQAPLFIVLHGWNESPSTMETRLNAGVLAAREKVIVALPPGRDANWDASFRGDDVKESKDIVFLAGMVDHLVDRYRVDPQRVYVGGFSIGAVLADRVGCQMAEQVMALVIVSGAQWHTECHPAHPVSVLVVHGTSDPTFPVQDATHLAMRWRTVNNCVGDPEETLIDETASALISADCAGGSQVELVIIEGLGHDWSYEEPDVTQLAWQFVSSVGIK
jgi:polyhydroxybutyrate depolymerase